MTQIREGLSKADPKPMLTMSRCRYIIERFKTFGRTFKKNCGGKRFIDYSR